MGFAKVKTAIFPALAALVLLIPGPAPARGDGVRDNDPAHVRLIPPIGNDLEPSEKQSLQHGLDELGAAIDGLRKELADKPALLAFLPDVQIFYNAVQYPLADHENIDVGMARRALAHGMARAAALREGKTPWTSVTGPRGYVSRIDGSVQPYVLSIPSAYARATAADPAPKRWRMDVWGHGRDELLTELRFVEMDDLLHEHKYLNQPLEPTDRFILSLYGRYINAFKFAGEIDGLEAMGAVKSQYPIDENRVLVIGFSMGGASSWEYAVHYTDLWAAAAPAAGFAETREFLKFFQKEDVSAAPWYQQSLWHLYDCTDYVANLYNLPTVAYGGELDPQKQASDIMLKAAAQEGVHLDRIVGRGIGHHYTPEAKEEIDRRLDEILAKGRNPLPDSIRFTTWTLRYNHMYWVTVDALQHHWQRARVDAQITRGTDHKATDISAATQNVAAITLTIPAALSPFPAAKKLAVVIDGDAIDGVTAADGGVSVHLFRDGGHWRPQAQPESGLRKRHGLQGPIDDAFMDRFLIVRPTGRPMHETTGKWAAAECDHAIEHWFKQFRGHPRVKNDVDVTDADLAEGNVVLFGDPSSNKALARLIDRLPVRWTPETVTLGERSFAADRYVPVMIYPNPLHPDHYVVLNSGFTYREYDYLNNARQTPKLPDYAIIDVNTPRTSQSPGGVAAAGFFGEAWELLADDGRSSAENKATAKP
ncbi:MAG TPA: prolyl oligopeptidase family serine peptidase [Tepidisphaeraceae bacterium]|jgi:pimeloyl-ACP methyl ester carboxylesterase|nr:prolyl oligopeptidase family serine peptidase [Tepidisphaeraceae bacterium]